ncbi:MAG: cysteine hydrolase family protein [Chloroflexota bacterium]
MQKIPANTALLIIDVQNGFDAPQWGKRNNPNAEDNIVALLTAWREAKRPIYHVQHMSVLPDSPLRPGQIGNDFKPGAEPFRHEPQFQKTVNSAFIGTDLEIRLREDEITDLVIVGLTTNHCVSTSTRMAGNLGFNAWLVSDATATFERTAPDGTHYTAEVLHNVTLANLHGEFATVVDTQAVLGATYA